MVVCNHKHIRVPSHQQKKGTYNVLLRVLFCFILFRSYYNYTISFFFFFSFTFIVQSTRAVWCCNSMLRFHVRFHVRFDASVPSFDPIRSYMPIQRYDRTLIRSNPIRFNSIRIRRHRFDQIQSNSIRFDSIQSNSMQSIVVCQTKSSTIG